MRITDYYTFVEHPVDGGDSETKLVCTLDLFPNGNSTEDPDTKITFVEIVDTDTGTVHFITPRATKYCNPFDESDDRYVVIRPGPGTSEKGATLRLVNDHIDTLNELTTSTASPPGHNVKDQLSQEVAESTMNYIDNLLAKTAAGKSAISLSQPKRKRGMYGNNISLHKEAGSIEAQPKKKKRVTFFTQMEDATVLMEDDEIEDLTDTALGLNGPRLKRTTPIYHMNHPEREERRIKDNDVRFSILWIDEPHWETCTQSFGPCTARTAPPVTNWPRIMVSLRQLCTAEMHRVVFGSKPVIAVSPHVNTTIKRLTTIQEHKRNTILDTGLEVPCSGYQHTDSNPTSRADKLNLVREIVIARYVNGEYANADQEQLNTVNYELDVKGTFLHTMHRGILNRTFSLYDPMRNFNTAPCIQSQASLREFVQTLSKVSSWSGLPSRSHWYNYSEPVFQQSRKGTSFIYSHNLDGSEGVRLIETRSGLPSSVDEKFHLARGTGFCRPDQMMDQIHLGRGAVHVTIKNLIDHLANVNYVEMHHLETPGTYEGLVTNLKNPIMALIRSEFTSIAYDAVADLYLIASSLLPVIPENGISTCVLTCEGPLSRIDNVMSLNEVNQMRGLKEMCRLYFDYSQVGPVAVRRVEQH